MQSSSADGTNVTVKATVKTSPQDKVGRNGKKWHHSQSSHANTVDQQVTANLANAKLFSVIDARDGFLQVKLDEESSFLTTFWTP